MWYSAGRRRSFKTLMDLKPQEAQQVDTTDEPLALSPRSSPLRTIMTHATHTPHRTYGIKQRRTHAHAHNQCGWVEHSGEAAIAEGRDQ